MEAYEAPEKLYIDFRDRAESTWRCAFTEKAMANDIEYTQTEAFIDKAVVWISNNCYMPHSTLEDFKKYMKGE